MTKNCARDYKKALQEFSRGLKIQPGNAQLYNAIAVVQRREGRLAESVQNFTRALELDPRSHLKAFDVALTHGLMRHYGEAHSYLNRTTGLSPDWSIPYVYQAWLHILQTGDVPRAQSVLDQAALATGLYKSQYYWWLARIVEPNYDSVLLQTRPGADTAAYMLHRAQLYRLMGRREEERACADTALRILKHKEQTETLSPRQLSDLGLAYAGLRDEKAALAYASQAAELLPTSRDAFDALFLLVNLAEVQVIFGRYDDAIVQLTYLLSIPGFVTVPYLKRDPLWKPLHNHPGFARLVAQAT